MPGFVIRSCAFIGLLLAQAQASVPASSLAAPHVRVSLISSHEAVVSGEDLFLGFEFRLDPHWHIYWKNPGDSGAAPKFKLQTKGMEPSEVSWPVPERIPLGDLTNLGYEESVIFPLKARISSTDQEVSIQAKLEWLVCREECIPGFGELALRLPVEKSARLSSASRRLNEAFSRVPQPVAAKDFPWGRELRLSVGDEENITLSWAPRQGFEDLPAERIFPVDGELFSPGTPRLEKKDGRLHARFKTLAPPRESSTDFLFVSKSGDSFEVRVPTGIGGEPGQSLWLLLIFAFLGGMILNLMPCVFPVLSIKVFSFLKAHEDGGSSLTKDGVFYTLGTLLTFSLLGLGFLILRWGGQEVGWGFQLQSPLIVFCLAALFFSLALNFLGVFEIGTSVMNWAGLRVHQRAWTSAFGTGILSVLVAAPCTGPFMGAALGASAFLPPFAAFSVFFVMGLGLAFPVLVLCLFPAWLSRLPRPGAWMNTLKEFFAFPLFATVIWLLWVLVQQTGSAGWLWAASGFLALTFSLWIMKGRGKWIGVVLLPLGLGISGWNVHQLRARTDGGATENAGAHSPWKAYDEELIATARAEGRPVFIDFTAAWCITCQWNKKSVLETQDAQELFSSNKALLIRADWTNYDPLITRALERFGRASVPLYVFHGSDGKEPLVLPQILTKTMISDLFAKHESKKEEK